MKEAISLQLQAGGQAAVGDVGEGNPRAIWRSLMRIRSAIGDDDRVTTTFAQCERALSTPGPHSNSHPPTTGPAVGSQSAWRMAMYLPGRLQNSHRNGGRVCLIFVADPRTAQLFRNFSPDDDRDTGRGRQSVGSLGMLMPT